MYKEMTKDLQDNIISALAESDNSSLSSLKNMVVKETPRPVEQNTEPKFVWSRTKEDMDNKKRLTDEEKLFIADKIEKASTVEVDGSRYITRFELGKLADRYFISVASLINYMKEYTSVKMDHNFHASYSPINKTSAEIIDQIIDDLKTTALFQYEIAELANVSAFVVSNLKNKNGIERPNEEEDEEVKKKTKARRLKLQNKNKASSNITIVKKEAEPVTTVEEKVQEVQESIIEPEKEIKPESTVEVTEEPIVDTTVATDTEKSEVTSNVEEFTRKPGVYTQNILHNKNISRITSASPVFECVLVDGRHSTPAVKGVFKEGLDKDTMFNYQKQLETCEDFLKKYLKFDSEGRANKSVKLYCTGLQSPLVSFIKACENLKVNLSCLHYDNDIRSYRVQDYSVNKYPTYQEIGVGVSAIYKTFGDYIYKYKCTVMKDIEQSTNCLYIIVCNENAHKPDKKTSAVIVCKSVTDYKELFMSIVSTMINMKPEDFSVEVRKFNFDSEGNVIKNSLVSYYEIK